MSLDHVRLHLVESLDDALAFKEWLGTRHENDAVGVDTETTGFNPYETGAGIRLIQFGDTQHGWAIPWEDWRGLAMEALRSYQGTWIVHNLAFEQRWMLNHAQWGYPAERTIDTMLGAHIMNPLGSAALKRISRQFVDSRAAAGQQALANAMKDNGWDFGTVPLSYGPFHQYAALDPVLNCMVWDRGMRTDLGPGGRYSRVFALENDVRFSCSKMEYKGARVDLDYCAEKGALLRETSDRLLEWGETTYGINIGSNQEVADKIVSLGGQIFAHTLAGAPQVDKYMLAIHADPDNGYSEELREFATNVRIMRRNRKYASTYFDSFQQVVAADGRIHTEIRTLGARTGRMSSANPNLQNVPKESPLVRNAIIASDGNQLVTVDYSQIEMRMMAHFARDEGLRAAFRNADATGGDFFVEVGKLVYSDPSFTKKDKRRNLIKSQMYGMGYGAGVEKMAETANVPVPQMQEAVDALTESFPGIKSFMTEVEAVGSERLRSEGQGYIITPSGRRLPCDDKKQYTLVNYLLQSTAGDVLKNAIIRLDAAGYDDVALFPVHDEVVFDIPKEEVDHALREIPEIMADMSSFSVELPADAEGGFTRWGEKYM